MNKSIKTLAFALLAMSLLGACTPRSNNKSSSANSSGNSSGSGSSVSSESGSSSSSSSSSEPIPETIDGTLELLAQKIATKKAMVTVPDYRRAEYLGPNIAVSTYLGDHASSGTYYYFVNEQGYFCYQDTGEGPVLKSKDLDPEIDLYVDKIYSMYDAFDEHFGEYVLLDSSTEDAWIVDFDVENGAAYKGGFATVVGYGYSDGAFITEIKATIAKNASSIDLTVTLSDSSTTLVETASITEIGTHENADALAVINAIPPYVPEPVVWPAEDVAAIIEALVPGSPTVLPECPGGENVKVYSSLKEVDVKGPESLKDAYKAILTTALWTEEPADSYVFISPARDIQASLSWNSTYGLEIRLAVYVTPNYDWPAEDIAAAFVTAGTTAFAFPSLTGEGFTYEFDDSNIASYKVAIVRIGGTVSAAALPGYKTALETAGWTVEYNESYDEYYASKTFEDGIANLTFYFYNNKISILIYLVKDPLPSATWPADEIAAYLGVGVTDEVPAYEGEATSFQFFAEYGVVLVGVAEGTEASAVSAYQTALANANYVTDVEDSYGVHYISENNQIDVVAYAYATGQIAIAIAPSPIFAAFPVTKVNAFLTEYDLGFSLTASMFEGLSATQYRLASGTDYWGEYHFVSVTVAGDLADEFTTILSPILTAAGYQYDSDEDYWYNSDVHQVNIGYDSTNGVTEVYFWE